MKYMSLFSPSPYSFYRVKEFAELEEADHLSQMADASPSMYIRLMAYEVIEKPDTTRKANGDRDKYMVLWLDMPPCCHLMREFESLEAAIAFASAQNPKLRTPPDKFGHGISGSLRLLSFKTIREWNVSQKPTGRLEDIWSLKKRGTGAVYGKRPEGWGTLIQ